MKETMKVFLGGMLWVMLVFGVAMPLLAEENGFTGTQSPLLFNSNAYMNINYDVFAEGTETGYQDFSTGRRVGAGFMNIFFGLGSYAMGDWRGGLWLTLFDVGTIPLFVWGVWFLSENEGWFSFPKYFSTGKLEWDIILLVPLWYSIVVVFWTIPYIGIASYVANFIYKFIRPFEYRRPAAKTARLDDLRNWDIGLMPVGNGKMSGQIAFTAHF